MSDINSRDHSGDENIHFLKSKAKFGRMDKYKGQDKKYIICLDRVLFKTYYLE